MRRTKLVLAAVAVLVAMLVAFSAPAMANNQNERNVQNSSSGIFDSHNHHGNFGDCCSDGDDIEIGDLDGNFEIELDDDDVSLVSSAFGWGCLEWSDVFEELEWEEDCF